MIIDNLNFHNIRNLSVKIDHSESIAVTGWSGSGKSSFCDSITAESTKRLVTLLPKSDYRFLFPDLIETNYGALELRHLPFTQHIRNESPNHSARSTIGTSSGLFRAIRIAFARANDMPADYFSFNVPLAWCTACKGRGGLAGVICKTCGGSRYAPEVLAYRLRTSRGDIDIVAANNLTFFELADLGQELGFGAREQQIVANALTLGIGYLGLGRSIRTVSGGEFARILLSSRLGLSSGMLYIVDEPSLGLDARAIDTMLLRLNELGMANHIMIVDHADRVVSACERQLCFGPESGSKGGRLIDKMPLVSPIFAPNCETWGNEITLTDLSCRNIQIDKLLLPLNRIIVVTGDSGSGKTTLLRDTILPALKKRSNGPEVVYIGQHRNQSLTSRSTIATFFGCTDLLKTSLGAKRNRKCEFCNGTGIEDDLVICDWCLGTGFDAAFFATAVTGDVTVRDLLVRPVSEIFQWLPSELRDGAIDMLIRFGGGYLSLSRPLRGLSTGEYQRVHLARQAGTPIAGPTVFIFDEPSRGLSQNNLNSFVEAIRILVENPANSIWMIEHNPYLLANSDFVIDFGRRSTELITTLDVLPQSVWRMRTTSQTLPDFVVKVSGQLQHKICLSIGEGTPEQRWQAFRRAQKAFYGGLMKNLSATAAWIYGDYHSDEHTPTIAIDMEEDLLYSQHTFLYELLDLAGRLQQASGLPAESLHPFDIMRSAVLCRSCKGKGIITAFDSKLVVIDDTKGLWNGLLHPDVLKAIKGYNFSKIKNLFREIEKSLGVRLDQTHSLMDEYTRKILWFGLWDRSFRDKTKNTNYRWMGLNHLILKYMRTSPSILKAEIHSSRHNKICPCCDGTTFSHSRALVVRGHDIRELLQLPLDHLTALFPDITILEELAELLPKGTPANADIYSFPRSQQVKIKLFELAHKSFFGYRIFLNNVLPFIDADDPILLALASENEVIVCDDLSFTLTKKEWLSSLECAGLEKGMAVHQALGFKDVDKQLNRLKRSNPCPYCNGKGRFMVDNPEGDLDQVAITCDYCNGSGIGRQDQETPIHGFPARIWLEGSIDDVNPSVDADLCGVRLIERIQLLPKHRLSKLSAHIIGSAI